MGRPMPRPCSAAPSLARTRTLVFVRTCTSQSSANQFAYQQNICGVADIRLKQAAGAHQPAAAGAHPSVAAVPKPKSAHPGTTARTKDGDRDEERKEDETMVPKGDDQGGADREHSQEMTRDMLDKLAK